MKAAAYACKDRVGQDLGCQIYTAYTELAVGVNPYLALSSSVSALLPAAWQMQGGAAKSAPGNCELPLQLPAVLAAAAAAASDVFVGPAAGDEKQQCNLAGNPSSMHLH
jgi:hypothetical protein